MSHRHVDHEVRVTGSVTCRPAERLKEHTAKLLSDGAVEDEVDGTVDVNEQVASVRQNDVRRRRLCVQRVDCVRHVVRQCWYLQIYT